MSKREATTLATKSPRYKLRNSYTYMNSKRNKKEAKYCKKRLVRNIDLLEYLVPLT